MGVTSVQFCAEKMRHLSTNLVQWFIEYYWLSRFHLKKIQSNDWEIHASLEILLWRISWLDIFLVFTFCHMRLYLFPLLAVMFNLTVIAKYQKISFSVYICSQKKILFQSKFTFYRAQWCKFIKNCPLQQSNVYCIPKDTKIRRKMPIHQWLR